MPPFLHDLAKLRNLVSSVSSVVGSRTAKYFEKRTQGVGTAGSKIGSWDPIMRYRSECMTFQDARAWYDEAYAIYFETVYQMFLDGVV